MVTRAQVVEKMKRIPSVLMPSAYRHKRAKLYLVSAQISYRILTALRGSCPVRHVHTVERVGVNTWGIRTIGSRKVQIILMAITLKSECIGYLEGIFML
jgi:hypothetical protein